MRHHISSLRERFFAHLPPWLMKSAERSIDSSPFAVICLCVLLLPFCIGLLFSVTYIFTFLYGSLSGQALPSREIFFIFPSLTLVFAEPAVLAKALLAYAFTGFSLSYLLQREHQPDFARRFLAALGRQWNAVSFLIIFSLLFATLGEVYVAYRSDYPALAGIMPYSDARGHYAHYTKYFYDGVMGDWVLRRPLAAFMGASLHWLAGNDPATALLWRCLLVCCGMWASCALMNRFFGVWSALACLALEYSYIGKYLHTYLTEPLGFFWGCMAAALWVQALHRKRLFWGLAAFSVTLVGLLVRMGSMFLVPTLFLYVLWRRRDLQPGHGWWKKPLLGLCLCAVAIGLLNATYARQGQGDGQQTGSNFSYSFAGLTLGTMWSEPRKLYAKQLAALKNEKQKSRFLYKQGIKNILHSPAVFFKRLAEGEGEFLKNFDFFLFHKWSLVCLAGAVLIIRRKTLFSRSTTSFWIATWGGILLSIPFIYFDESWRVNIVVYPLIACFFSLALARRYAGEEDARGAQADAVPWLAVLLSGGLLLLMTSVALFPRLHTTVDIQKLLNYKASLPNLPPNRFLVAARGMGFLVVPDGEEPDPAVPSMTWSTFRDRYHAFEPAVGESLFTGELPKPPFVVLNQVPLAGPGGYFITPPEVITSKNVLLWEFEADRPVKNTSTRVPWMIVARVKPLLQK